MPGLSRPLLRRAGHRGHGLKGRLGAPCPGHPGPSGANPVPTVGLGTSSPRGRHSCCPALPTGTSGHCHQSKVRSFCSRTRSLAGECGPWADGLRVISASLRWRAGPRGKPTKATVTRRPVVSLDRTPEHRRRPSWPHLPSSAAMRSPNGHADSPGFPADSAPAQSTQHIHMRLAPSA